MIHPKDIPHPDQDTLLAYVRGELDAAAEHQIEYHALHCPACDEVIEGLMLLQEQGLLETAAFPAAPETPVRKLQPRRYWSAAAAIVVLIGLGWLSSMLLPEGEKPKVAQDPAVPPREEKVIALQPETDAAKPRAETKAAPAPRKPEQPEIRSYQGAVTVEENMQAAPTATNPGNIAFNQEAATEDALTRYDFGEADLEKETKATLQKDLKAPASIPDSSAKMIALQNLDGVRNAPAYTSPESSGAITLNSTPILSQPLRWVTVDKVTTKSKKSRALSETASKPLKKEESDSLKETRFRKELAAKPGNYSALEGMADLYFKKADYATALSYYQQAATAPDAKDPDLMKLNQARCLIRMKRSEEAKVILQQLDKSKYSKEAQKLLKGL